MISSQAFVPGFPAQSGKPLHVLTITPFYPNSRDDAEGCFIEEPLRANSLLGVTHSVISVNPFYRPRKNCDPASHAATQLRFPAIPGGVGLASAGAFLFARLLNAVRKLHRENAVNIIHSHSALPCGHAAALLQRELGIPYVVTVHGLDAYSTDQVKGYAGKWCQQVSRFVYRAATRVICVSEKVRERILAVAPQARTEVVYNGVDTERFRPPDKGRESQDMTILSVGNLIPIKGHELLIRAFAELQPEFPDASLEIIGDGPELTRLIALAGQLKISQRVRWMGRRARAEVAGRMRNCTIFALPSTFEALGCVYLEAMASAKPAIGCRHQGIDEVIEHGANGWLIRPNDLQDLTEALRTLLGSQTLREEIGAAARETILRNFTLDHQAQELRRIYEDCVA